jgi:hypothetical protein
MVSSSFRQTHAFLAIAVRYLRRACAGSSAVVTILYCRKGVTEVAGLIHEDEYIKVVVTVVIP